MASGSLNINGGKYGALKWYILVVKQKKNVQKRKTTATSRTVNFFFDLPHHFYIGAPPSPPTGNWSLLGAWSRHASRYFLKKNQTCENGNGRNTVLNIDHQKIVKYTKFESTQNVREKFGTSAQLFLTKKM